MIGYFSLLVDPSYEDKCQPEETEDMSRKKTWEISDAFWELVQPLIPTDPRVDNKTYQRQRGGGRKPKYSNRLYFSAIVYVLRTGIIWNALPREKFGWLSSSALHD